MPGVHVHIIPIATIGAVLPVNYAAGDLTVTSRLFVGDVALQTEARFAQVYDSYTPATPSVNNSLFVLVNASPPAGAAADELRAIKAELNVRPTAAYAGSGTGIYAEADHDSGAFNVAALTGGFFQGIQEVAATTATVVYGGRAAYRAILGTIGTAIGLDIIKGNAADAGAITTAIGLRILASAGVVPTTDIGMQVLGNVQSRIVGPLTLGADAAPTAGFNLDIQAGNLRLVNSQVTGVYLRVGSTTAPTNVTAGDLTAVRISLGNTGALAGAGLGHTIDVQNTMTDTTAGAKAFAMLRPVVTPASNSSSEFRSLYFQMIVNPATTITLSQIRSGWFETRFRQDGAVSEAIGVVVQPVTVDSGSAATVGTITTGEGIRMNLYARPSGTSVITVTSMIGLNFPAARLGTGLTVPTLRDIFIANPTAPTSITTHIGIDIEALTRGATLNLGIRNADAMRQTGYLSLLGATVVPLNVTAGDFSAVRGMFGTDTSLASGPVVMMKAAAVGSEVLRLMSVGAGAAGDARISWYQGAIETTDNAFHTLVSVTVPADTTIQIDGAAQGRRTGGAAGTAGDSGGYEDRGVFKNIGGVVTQVGTTDHSLDKEDQATWDADFGISGTAVQYQVMGATNNNVRWHGNIKVMGWVS